MKIIVANGTPNSLSLQHATRMTVTEGPLKEFRDWVRERDLQGCRAVISVPADKAEDIANGVLFFASDLASWISGQTISIDGGRHMV